MAGTPLAPLIAKDGDVELHGGELHGADHPAPRPYTVGVRMKFGDELEGLDVHDDGVTFRSGAPMQPGKMIELMLCNGSLLVDAVVIHCAPLRDGEGGFAVRTRYHQTSQALSSLIYEEITRLTGEASR
jgi:hypothetical protein